MRSRYENHTTLALSHYLNKATYSVDNHVMQLCNAAPSS